uniref:Glycosyltransferase n=1 Tax=Ascaris lumbricoides TaxID=6252 RepID=A0A0M3IHN2_ASCLU
MKKLQFIINNKYLLRILPAKMHKRYRNIVFILIAIVLLIIVEEIHVAKLRATYRNFYYETIYSPIHISRFNGFIKPRNIMILIVLNDSINLNEYRIAMETFKCYSIYHRYRMVVVDFAANETLREICDQKDFMFARHCVTVQKLIEEQVEWIFFVDADMAVINPNRLIEEWIDNDVAVILYDRIMNSEVAAGSYLVKNTDYSRNFLRSWASYDRKVPNSFHGTDNGALQILLLEMMAPSKVEEAKRCRRIWQQSRNYADLSVYEACARSALGGRKKWNAKLSILRKGTSWVRDSWLTNSMWSSRDFVLHGWKLSTMDAPLFASWSSPLSSHEIDVLKCSTENASYNWHYKDTFIRSNKEIESMINEAIKFSHGTYLNDLGKIASYL